MTTTDPVRALLDHMRPGARRLLQRVIDHTITADIHTASAALPAPFDVDTLPPVQYLIMETLAARYRLGEADWTFPTHAVTRTRLNALSAKGLIGWKYGVDPHSVLAWLTDTGRAAVLRPTYVPPIYHVLSLMPGQEFR